MVQCVNGHTICEDHVIGGWDNLYDKLMSKTDDDDECEYEDLRYDLPEQYCPICSFETLTDQDHAMFLMKEFNVTVKQSKEIIKSRFDSYGAFISYLKGKD